MDVHPFMFAEVKCHTYSLGAPGIIILPVFNLELDIYVMAVQQKAFQKACFPIKQTLSEFSLYFFQK